MAARARADAAKDTEQRAQDLLRENVGVVVRVVHSHIRLGDSAWVDNCESSSEHRGSGHLVERLEPGKTRFEGRRCG